jgi:hypothetical protein
VSIGSCVTIIDSAAVQALDLDRYNYPFPTGLHGVGQVSATQYLSPILVEFGASQPVSICPYYAQITDRILGVDVTNSVRIYKDGPARRTIILE